MIHDSFYTVEANTPYELGQHLGQLFAASVKVHIANQKSLPAHTTEFIKNCFLETRKYYPEYAEEIEGYACGAEVSLDSLWQMMLEDDLDLLDKCTTFVTNEGRLIAHNEDWDPTSTERIFVLKTKMNGRTKLELHYAGTLGSNSVAITSDGYVQAINSLHPTEEISYERPLISTNVIARMLSDSNNLEADITALQDLPRISGYSHILINTISNSRHYTIEATHNHFCAKPIEQFPFLHSNHYLMEELLHLEDLERMKKNGSLIRYDAAQEKLKKTMSVDDAKNLLDSNEHGPKHSLMNENTIGRIIVDLDKRQAHIWLKREEEKGWICYDLDFLP